MTDYGKPQDDMTQQDDHAHELIEHLNLLETVDRRITPQHVAKRFYELLEDTGDDEAAPSAEGHLQQGQLTAAAAQAQGGRVLAPADVRDKQFSTTRLRPGYDQEEVDAFLDEVEAELDRLIQENEGSGPSWPRSCAVENRQYPR